MIYKYSYHIDRDIDCLGNSIRRSVTWNVIFRFVVQQMNIKHHQKQLPESFLEQNELGWKKKLVSFQVSVNEQVKTKAQWEEFL